MREALAKRGIEPIGSVRYEPEVFKSCLADMPLEGGGVRDDVEKIIDHIEEAMTK